MNTLRRKISIIALWLFAAILSECANDSPVAAGNGSGTNTGNAKVACVIHTPDNGPAAHVPVQMRRIDYLSRPPEGYLGKPGFLAADTATGPDGMFTIDAVDTGTYLIAVGDSTSAVVIPCTITALDSHISIPDDTLEPTGSITGSIPVSAARRYEAWVQVYGLEKLARVDPNTGIFMLSGMPAGEYDIRVSTSMPTYSPAIVPAVSVAPEASVSAGAVHFPSVDTEDYSQWEHTRRLYLNTTTKGAGVAETVTGFPLCIRLDTTTFDFSQTQTTGADMRFSRNDVHLPYEIEHWDHDARSAVIWVRADTVWGDNDTQTITMHWGNPAAPDLSDGAAVFDAREGFAGVWHLGGDYRDATANANHGAASASNPATEGALGHGQSFDGIDDHIDCGTGASLAFGGQITVSAWVRLANPSIDRYYRILSKKNPWDGPSGYELECNPVHEGGYLTLVGQNNTIARASIGWDSAWHYCVATFDGNSGKVYRDGIYRSAAWSKITAMLPGENPLVIGGIGPDNYFFGELDEVRVCAVARTPAWIKLCQANQNPYGQTLVEFK